MNAIQLAEHTAWHLLQDTVHPLLVYCAGAELSGFADTARDWHSDADDSHWQTASVPAGKSVDFVCAPKRCRPQPCHLPVSQNLLCAHAQQNPAAMCRSKGAYSIRHHSRYASVCAPCGCMPVLLVKGALRCCLLGASVCISQCRPYSYCCCA